MTSCFVVTCVRRVVRFSCSGVDAIDLVALWIARVADPRAWKIAYIRCTW